MKDKYAATWVSFSSMRNFLECPRAYFLAHVYRDPTTRHKIRLMSPPLALGQAVHEVIESLSVLPTTERFKDSLVLKLDDSWEKIAGKKGGFADVDIEQRYKKRGQEMLRNLMNNPGPLKNKAVKIQQDLPHYWLSEEDDIILCGKIDWLEYLESEDAVHIIDFKTGKGKENDDSLQLPIYLLIVSHCQSRPVSRASYWYIDQQSLPEEQVLPELDVAEKRILEVAKKIKLHRQLQKFTCPQGGCRACEPLERILKGEGDLVGTDEYNYDIYILPSNIALPEEEIL